MMSNKTDTKTKCFKRVKCHTKDTWYSHKKQILGTFWKKYRLSLKTPYQEEFFKQRKQSVKKWFIKKKFISKIIPLQN